MCSFFRKSKDMILVLELLLLFRTIACDFDKTVSRVLKSYEDCVDNNNTKFWNCLENESISILDQVEKQSTAIPLVEDTVELVRDRPPKDANQDLSAMKQKSKKTQARIFLGRDFDFSIMRKISKFLKNRSLQIKVPIFWPDIFQDAAVEGRGKKDKGNSVLAGALLIGLMMTIGSLAMLSGKALMTSFIALTLAALSHRKSGSAALHGATTYEVINVPAHRHH